MPLERTIRPLHSFRCTRHDRTLRVFTTTTPAHHPETSTTSDDPSPPPDPPTSTTDKSITPPTTRANLVHTPRSERILRANHNISPIGSRRRRAAIASSTGIPFHQLPYQCFQEARKVLMQERREMVGEMEKQRGRIAGLKESVVAPEDEGKKEHRLRSMRTRLHALKISADKNDPIVKKKFEDGLADMNKPIYRHLADTTWRSHKRKILMQRITQMTVIPDVLPSIDPVVSTSLSFGKKNIPHGEIVPSLTETAPSITIQPYDSGERLVTIAVINPDVPDVSKDGFGYRCHFLACNVRISPTETLVRLGELHEEAQVVLEWLAPYAQKGLGYQRLCVFVLEQPARERDEGVEKLGEEVVGGLNSQSAEGTRQAATQDIKAAEEQAGLASPITPEPTSTATDASSATATATATATDSPTQPPTRSLPLPTPLIKSSPSYTTRENFNLRSLVTKHTLKPVGVDLFRTKWDDGTAEVMRRAGVVGADVEFRRKRVEPLPYKRLGRGRYR